MEKDERGWEKLVLDITLPDSIDFRKAASYIWSIEGEEAWLDDFEVDRRPPVEKNEIPPLGYHHFPLLLDAEQRTDDGLYFLAKPRLTRFKNTEMITSDRAHSGEYAIVLDAERSFAWNLRYGEITAGEEVEISLWQFGPSETLAIVFSSLDGQSFYRLEDDDIVEEAADGWRKLRLRLTIPSDANFKEAASYLWNRGGKKIWIDDLEVKRIPPHQEY